MGSSVKGNIGTWNSNWLSLTILNFSLSSKCEDLFPLLHANNIALKEWKIERINETFREPEEFVNIHILWTLPLLGNEISDLFGYP